MRTVLAFDNLFTIYGYMTLGSVSYCQIKWLSAINGHFQWCKDDMCPYMTQLLGQLLTKLAAVSKVRYDYISICLFFCSSYRTNPKLTTPSYRERKNSRNLSLPPGHGLASSEEFQVIVEIPLKNPRLYFSWYSWGILGHSLAALENFQAIFKLSMRNSRPYFSYPWGIPRHSLANHKELPAIF